MPRQRSTSVTEQAKVDLGSHIEGDNVQKLSSRTIGYSLHLFMVRRPSVFCFLFELRSVLEDFRPSLLAILQEEACVELNAAGDLKFSGLTVLVADLWGTFSNGIDPLLICFFSLWRGSDDVTLGTYLVGCTFAINEQHLVGENPKNFRRVQTYEVRSGK
jgi:hypothetical protein